MNIFCGCRCSQYIIGRENNNDGGGHSVSNRTLYEVSKLRSSDHLTNKDYGGELSVKFWFFFYNSSVYMSPFELVTDNTLQRDH